MLEITQLVRVESSTAQSFHYRGDDRGEKRREMGRRGEKSKRLDQGKRKPSSGGLSGPHLFFLSIHASLRGF